MSLAKATAVWCATLGCEARQPKRPVLVRGDANGPYQHVVSTLVLLQQAEVGSVGLVTDPEEAR